MPKRSTAIIRGRALAALLILAAGAGGAYAQMEGRRPVPSFGREEDRGPSQRYLNPGPVAPGEQEEFVNPFAGDPDAVAEGGRLFVWYHCAECHAPGAGGFIGPSLRDPYFRYGGDPISIYQSIWAGRPQGMPTWANKIPDDQIWKIVAFIQSLQDEEPDALAPGSSWE